MCLVQSLLTKSTSYFVGYIEVIFECRDGRCGTGPFSLCGETETTLSSREEVNLEGE